MAIDLILKDINDKYVRENFFRLSNFINQEVFFQGDFFFFEIDIPKADPDYKIRHGLNFVPQDVFFLAVEGDHRFYFKWEDFDKEFIHVYTSGPCVIRFIAGRLSEKGRQGLKGKYPHINPFGILNITSISPEIVVTNPNGPNVVLEFVPNATVSASPGFTWGRSGQTNAGTYLQNDTVPSNQTGRIVPISTAEISKVFVANEASNTFSINVLKRIGVGSFTTLATISLVAQRVKTQSFTGVSVALGDEIAVQVASGSCKNPVVGIVILGTI